MELVVNWKHMYSWWSLLIVVKIHTKKSVKKLIITHGHKAMWWHFLPRFLSFISQHFSFSLKNDKRWAYQTIWKSVLIQTDLEMWNQSNDCHVCTMALNLLTANYYDMCSDGFDDFYMLISYRKFFACALNCYCKQLFIDLVIKINYKNQVQIKRLDALLKKLVFFAGLR